MDGEVLWNIIITDLSSSGKEIRTKRGLWFRALSLDGKLYVDKAADNMPSSELSTQRPISKNDFLLVYSYYDRWLIGEKGIRNEVSKKSMNTAYIFALIDRFNNRVH